MKDKQIEGIISDPFAPEALWLKACAAGAKDLPVRCEITPGTANMHSAALAICTSAYAMFAYDWGREVLEEIIGTLGFGGAMSIAATINLCIILPVSYGLFSGFFQKKREPGTAIGALVLASAGIVSSVALFGVMPVWAFSFAGIGLLTAFASNAFGAIVREEMQFKSILRRVFLPALVYLIPSAIFALAYLNNGNFGYKEEVFVFLSLLFVSSSWAARRCQAKSLTAGMAAAFFCSLPIATMNLINMFGLMAVFIFDPTNFFAALSSTMIVVGSTTAAAAAGGCYGALRTQYRNAKRLTGSSTV